MSTHCYAIPTTVEVGVRSQDVTDEGEFCQEDSKEKSGGPETQNEVYTPPTPQRSDQNNSVGPHHLGQQVSEHFPFRPSPSQVSHYVHTWIASTIIGF